MSTQALFERKLDSVGPIWKGRHNSLAHNWPTSKEYGFAEYTFFDGIYAKTV